MRRTSLGAVLLAGAAFACSGDTIPATGLVLGLQLDLAVPKDTDHVAVYVALLKDGRRISQPPAELRGIDQSTVSFVAELVLESHDPTDRVQVRFVAFDANEKVIAMREARSPVPSEGNQLLRMPLLWINEGKVQDNAPAATPASTGVGLRDVELLDATDDAFTRYTDGCAAEQTLGNDGACRSIDVPKSELLELEDSVRAPEPTCMDLTACFTGSQTREIALTPTQLADGWCELDIDATEQTQKPALTLFGPDLGGFPLEPSADARNVRPIDGALYDYDAIRSVLRLKPALCDKIRRKAITTAIVSAKCDPKDTDVPVCGASNQRSSGVRPTNTGVFVGDGPDGGPPDDGGTDADADASTLPPSISQTVPLLFDTVHSFAVRGGEASNIWIEGDRAEVYHVHATPWLNPTASVEVTAPGSAFGTFRPGQLSIDQRASAFLKVPNADGDITYNYGLGPGSAPTVALPILLCAVDGCASGSGCDRRIADFTVGDQGTETVGIIGKNVGSAAPAAAAIAAVKRGTASQHSCFEPRPGAAQQTTPTFGSPSNLTPAITVGSDLILGFRISGTGGTSTQLLRARDTQLLGQAHAEDFDFIAHFGAGIGLTATAVGGNTRFTPLDFSADVPAVGVSTTSFGSVQEMFGGPNIACMRAQTERAAPFVVLCQLRLNATYQEIFPVLDRDSSGDPFDPHVYSDEKYLYVGQHCADDTFSVRGVPFERLQSRDDVTTAFRGICGGDSDAGIR